MYAELRNDYYDEKENCITIDGWKTCDDNEEGTVVAFVFPERVVYVDNGARLNEEVNELIAEAQEELRQYDYYSQIVEQVTILQFDYPAVCSDVLKRASDWIVSGGARNSDYLKKQLAHLTRVNKK